MGFFFFGIKFSFLNLKENDHSFQILQPAVKEYLQTQDPLVERDIDYSLLNWSLNASHCTTLPDLLRKQKIQSTEDPTQKQNLNL
jgi:hypothetical protein